MTPEDEVLADESVKEAIPMEDTAGREYRYQWDWNVPGGMAHVRCDDWETFVQARKNMETLIPQTQAFPNDSGATATPPEKVTNDPSWCKIHKVTMKKWQKEGRSWYSHQAQDGTWCKGE